MRIGLLDIFLVLVGAGTPPRRDRPGGQDSAEGIDSHDTPQLKKQFMEEMLQGSDVSAELQVPCQKTAKRSGVSRNNSPSSMVIIVQFASDAPFTSACCSHVSACCDWDESSMCI